MKVVKVEDGLAVRLPEEVVESLGLKEGDEVEVQTAGGAAVCIGDPERKSDAARKAALESLQALRRPFPPDFRFNRDEANERGGGD